ncbi:hypothetical protein SBA4_5360010 [Candidatus Sulfopaludibacter sp. SbA4]|nr:hypothetical protein SBA4_5360010 [Candidatus Sulfopaludibacter sp. SbA4]
MAQAFLPVCLQAFGVNRSAAELMQ